jgi:hypothetical protein
MKAYARITYGGVDYVYEASCNDGHRVTVEEHADGLVTVHLGTWDPQTGIITPRQENSPFVTPVVYDVALREMGLDFWRQTWGQSPNVAPSE